MATPTTITKEQLAAELEKRADALEAQLAKKQKQAMLRDEFIKIKVAKSQSRFQRLKNTGKTNIGHGEFFVQLDITATNAPIFIPLSIASGKKSTGFIYHIEGTAEATIHKTTLTCVGDGVTKITLGTLVYAKIPAGKTGSFKAFIIIRGRTSKEYKIAINRVNYKLDPQDTRYKRMDVDIPTKSVRFL